MLLTESEKAKQVRTRILDIVIATINKRAGGGTKYINTRDIDFSKLASAGWLRKIKFFELRKNFRNFAVIKLRFQGMKIREMITRYGVFVLGLYFLAAGIVLIVRSALGTTPISSINYVLTLNSSLSLGFWTFVINMILILGQFLLVGSKRTKRDTAEILLQIPFSFVFSAFIDLNMALTSWMTPVNYAMSLALLAVGCVVQAIGVVLEIKPHVAMMSGEGFVKYASQRTGREFGRVKVIVDVSLVLIAIICSLLLSHTVQGVREGSVIAAVATGFIVTFLNTRIITRRNLSRLRRIAHV